MPNRFDSEPAAMLRHLEGNDLDFPNELFTQIHPLDEVVLDADAVQPRHDVFADAIVDDALALEHGFLRAVEGGGVVLEVLDQGAGFWTFIEDLGLALVDFLAACHAF
jgi:hypothetical protein